MIHISLHPPSCVKMPSAFDIPCCEQTRLMIHLGETLPAKLEGERRDIRWGTLLLLIGVLFPCSLVSFGIGAPTGAVMATSLFKRSAH